MTDLDELMSLRPLVSELRHTVEQLRRDKSELAMELLSERAMNEDLRKCIIALRNAARNDRTPAMGTPPIQEDGHG